MIQIISIDYQKKILDLGLLKQKYYPTMRKAFLNILENLFGMEKVMLNFVININ